MLILQPKVSGGHWQFDWGSRSRQSIVNQAVKWLANFSVMPTALNVAQSGLSRTSSIGEDDEERSPNGFNTSGSSFTKKLYEILDSAESSDIVCWTQGITWLSCLCVTKFPLRQWLNWFSSDVLMWFLVLIRRISFRSKGTEKTWTWNPPQIFPTCSISVVC